jgi:hypothetical protein
VALYFSDCGTAEQIWVRGPWFTRVDVRFRKLFPMGGRKNLEFNFEFLNALDNINFNPNFNRVAASTIFQVTSATRTSTTFDPGGRLGQLIVRFNF